VTPTVLEGFRREAVKAGIPLEDAIAFSVVQGWRGFRAAWHQKAQDAPGSTISRSKASGGHLANMPLGTPSCGCTACVEFRKKQAAVQ
jgi:hypothetical protein